MSLFASLAIAACLYVAMNLGARLERRRQQAARIIASATQTTPRLETAEQAALASMALRYAHGDPRPAMTDPAITEPEDNETAWTEVWEAQDALTRETGDRIGKLTEGRSGAYRTALLTYLIEYLAEQLRTSLRLPEPDVKEKTGHA